MAEVGLGPEDVKHLAVNVAKGFQVAAGFAHAYFAQTAVVALVELAAEVQAGLVGSQAAGSHGAWPFAVKYVTDLSLHFGVDDAHPGSRAVVASSDSKELASVAHWDPSESLEVAVLLEAVLQAFRRQASDVVDVAADFGAFVPAFVPVGS